MVTLPSAKAKTLGKDAISLHSGVFFAEWESFADCIYIDPRQTLSFHRVYLPWHSINFTLLLSVFCQHSQQKMDLLLSVSMSLHSAKLLSSYRPHFFLLRELTQCSANAMSSARQKKKKHPIKRCLPSKYFPSEIWWGRLSVMRLPSIFHPLPSGWGTWQISGMQ